MPDTQADPSANASVLTKLMVFFLLLLQGIGEKSRLKRKTAMVNHYYKSDQPFAFKIV